MIRMFLALILVLLPAACQRAGRYPAPGAAPEKEAKDLAPPPHWAWLPVHPRPDLPIRFVAEANPEWDRLPKFWNHFPEPAAGMRTIHLGHSPLGAAAALVLADAAETIKLKVPRGLPDPSPLIPEANPPTFGRWQLGKMIFAAPLLKAGADTYACTSCHQPGHGYTQPRNVSVGGTVNTLSLLNVAYNRRQFWDGRVGALEETLAQYLDDERRAGLADDYSVLVTHRWGGLVKVLAENREAREEFQRVFGIEQPTQDAVAKAVATYLRTLLSGDSLYDRAEAERVRHQAPELAATHFIGALDEAALRALDLGPKVGKLEAAARLAQGARLFLGKARCAVCHGGPLFTDHDYHNIGLGEKDSLPPLGEETSRFARVPIGLKEARLIGAWRTPTLRNLPRTAPYFHDGKRRNLREVVAFFNLHVDWDNPYLAPALRDAGHEGRLDLSIDDVDAIVLFLQALDGTRTEDASS